MALTGNMIAGSMTAINSNCFITAGPIGNDFIQIVPPASGLTGLTVKNSNGFIGLNTTNPSYLLDIAGVSRSQQCLVGVNAISNLAGSSPNGLILYSTVSATISSPHVSVYASSTTPIFQQLNWSADNVSLNFDSYFDSSGFKFSGSVPAFQLYKFSGSLMIRVAAGGTVTSPITWNQAFGVNAAGLVSIGSLSATYGSSTVLLASTLTSGTLTSGSFLGTLGSFSSLSVGSFFGAIGNLSTLTVSSFSSATLTAGSFLGTLGSFSSLSVGSLNAPIGSISTLSSSSLTSTFGNLGSLTIGSNIGINNSSPAFNLDVIGSAKISGSLTVSTLSLTNSTLTLGSFSGTYSSVTSSGYVSTFTSAFASVSTLYASTFSFGVGGGGSAPNTTSFYAATITTGSFSAQLSSLTTASAASLTVLSPVTISTPNYWKYNLASSVAISAGASVTPPSSSWTLSNPTSSASIMNTAGIITIPSTGVYSVSISAYFNATASTQFVVTSSDSALGNIIYSSPSSQQYTCASWVGRVATGVTLSSYFYSGSANTLNPTINSIVATAITISQIYTCS